MGVQQLSDPLVDPLAAQAVQLSGPGLLDRAACLPRLFPGGETYGECLDRRTHEAPMEEMEAARQALEEELAERSDLINAYQVVTNEDAQEATDAYREAIRSGDSEAMEEAAQEYMHELNEMIADLGDILAESEVGAVSAYGEFLAESRGFFAAVDSQIHAHGERADELREEIDPNAGTERGVR